MQQVGIKTNVKQVLRLLGPAMYKGDVTSVAVKELLQNSFDAVKKQADARIAISTNSDKNYIECIDNGIGMSPEIVSEVYLSIGGTWKENLDLSERSGGLGLAKVQFFLSASRIYISTVKDGIRTELDCTQEELLSGEATLQTFHTDSPSGTTVRLYYPTQYTDINGTERHITMPCYWSAPVCEHPLVGYEHIKVTFNGYNICQWQNRNEFLLSTYEFTWGDVDVYYNPRSYSESNYCIHSKIYSAGLYQFDYNFQKRIIGYLKLDCHINIKPKVAAGMAGYPFNNQREGFNVAVEEDIKTISKNLFDIQKIIQSEQIRASYASLVSLTYTDVDGSELEDKNISTSQDVNIFTDEFIHKLTTAYASCSRIYRESELSKAADTQLAASKQEEFSDLLKFKNDTPAQYQECYALFSKIASVVKDELMSLQEYFKEEAKFPTMAGIQISKELKGCLVSGSINALFINPLSCSYFTTSECWVQEMMDILIHELAHIRQEYHDEYFIKEQMKIKSELIHQGHYHALLGKLRKIYMDEQSAILSGSEKFSNV